MIGARSLVPAAAATALGVLLFVPVALLLSNLVREPSALLSLADPINLRAARNTLTLAFGVLTVSLALGVPLGFLVGRTDLPARTTWRVLCTVPYVVPPYVTAIAWIALLNPTNGLVNRALAAVGLGPIDVYTIGGMAFVMGIECTPFVMITVADALGRMDASLEEQARIAGASPLRVLGSVTLPLALPALVTAASFVLAHSAAAFGVPYLLASGTATPSHVLTTRVYNALDLDPTHGRPIAIVLCLVLLVIGVGLPALAGLAGRRARYVVVTGKAPRASPFALGRARWPATMAVAAFVITGAIVPLATIAVTSVMRNFGGGLDASNLTLANYPAVLMGRSDAMGALLRSLWLATCAATVAVAVGALLSWSSARASNRPAAAAVALGRLPYAVPGTIVALGLLLAWSQEIRVIVLDRATFVLAMSDTLWILGLAYVLKFLAFPIGSAETGLMAIDPSLEEAARTSGAGFLATLSRVMLPLLRPNLVAGWFLVFVPAFTEVTMSILLAGPETRVVGTLLFDLQTYGDPPSAAVLAMVVTAIVLAGSTGVRIATGGRVGI